MQSEKATSHPTAGPKFGLAAFHRNNQPHQRPDIIKTKNNTRAQKHKKRNAADLHPAQCQGTEPQQRKAARRHRWHIPPPAMVNAAPRRRTARNPPPSRRDTSIWQRHGHFITNKNHAQKRAFSSPPRVEK